MMTKRAIATAALALTVGCGGAASHGLDATTSTTEQERDRLAPGESFPTFDCQEDELMVWVDAPTDAECVNEGEYAHQLHVEAGHEAG